MNVTVVKPVDYDTDATFDSSLDIMLHSNYDSDDSDESVESHFSETISIPESVVEDDAIEDDSVHTNNSLTDTGIPVFVMPSITIEEWDDIKEECYFWIEEYLEENAIMMAKKTFLNTMYTDVGEYLSSVVGSPRGWYDDTMYEDLYEWVKGACRDVLTMMNIPPRETVSITDRTLEITSSQIDSTLKWLSTFPVQVQRSAEWYAVRRNLFSASNLWKLFSTPAQYNSLLYEKCKDVDKLDGLNSSSYGGDILSPGSRNWGIKYEPVSILVYEHKYNTKVNTNYGCIPHETLPIGASPDGINCKPNHPKYGHMVEVKNIYNRVMDGIPSMEYWTQTQIQMATCRLEYCDFLETRFKEYANSEEFAADHSHEYKGVIMFFIPRNDYDGSSHFEYVPLDIGKCEDKLNQWFEEKQKQLSGYVLYQISYWYLEEMYCTEIERNDFWFQKTIPTIQESWKLVLHERNHGFEHRAPVSKQRSRTMSSDNMVSVASTNDNNDETNGSSSSTVKVIQLSSKSMNHYPF